MEVVTMSANDDLLPDDLLACQRIIREQQRELERLREELAALRLQISALSASAPPQSVGASDELSDARQERAILRAVWREVQAAPRAAVPKIRWPFRRTHR